MDDAPHGTFAGSQPPWNCKCPSCQQAYRAVRGLDDYQPPKDLLGLAAGKWKGTGLKPPPADITQPWISQRPNADINRDAG